MTTRTRIVLYFVCLFVGLTLLSAAAVTMVTAESAKSCANSIAWMDSFRSRTVCTKFSYGKGPIPVELFQYFSARNLLQVPIYRGSELSSYRFERMRDSRSNESSDNRDLYILELTSPDPSSSVYAWYRSNLPPSFRPYPANVKNIPTAEWLSQLAIRPKVGVPIFVGQESRQKSNVYRGLVLATDQGQAKITVFELRERNE